MQKLFLEELEARNCPSSVCDANPVYAAECAYVDNLIPQSAITITAVQSGNWSDPATWGGRTPVKGDNVWIPQNTIVTVDTQEQAAIRSVLDSGTLTFAPGADTSLLVNTVVVGTSGELDMGTAANPIHAGYTASLIFADASTVRAGDTQANLFPNDSATDSAGLICQGTLNLHGSEVTPYVDMANVSAGATSLTLASAPVGWKAGDTLLIPGTTPGKTQDEQIKIASIDGDVIKLASPLQYSHSAPMGQTVQVANESRNVVIKDEGTATQLADGSDGHVMQMHSDAADIRYVAFLDPGRTDKSIPLGSKLPSGLVNRPNFYSLHFHRDYWPGITDNDPAIQVVGCYQQGSPGWGYDNHSSNVNFVDDVAFNDFGAAFVDQAGNEIGSFQDCLAIDTPGVPNSANLLNARYNKQDFGWNGSGYWLTSPSTSVIGDMSYEAQEGFVLFGLPLIQGPLGTTKTWDGKSVQAAPLATFSDDVAAANDTGLIVWYRLAQPATPDVIDHFTSWNTGQYGVTMSYNSHTDVVDPLLIGIHGSIAGLRSSGGAYSFFTDVNNANVSGFNTGFIVPSSSVTHVDGGIWNDPTAFYISSVNSPRFVQFSGPITFGPAAKTDYYMQTVDIARFAASTITAGYFNAPFSADYVFLPDGQQLFAADQAPNYIPFPMGTGLNLPAFLVGLTNEQIWSEYGMAPGGMVASADAMASPITNGLVGTAYASTEAVRALSPSVQRIANGQYHPVLMVYQPSTMNAVSLVQPAPITMQLGWNLVTEYVNGQKHSWLVYGR